MQSFEDHAQAPRADFAFWRANSATVSRASSVKRRRTFSNSKSRWYCDEAFFGSVKIRTSADLSRSSKPRHGQAANKFGDEAVANQVAGLHLLEQFGVALRGVVGHSIRVEAEGAAPTRASIIFSSPTKAPPHKKRKFVVSTGVNSWCGDFGRLAEERWRTVPSKILSRACWTPSPETSRVIEGFSSFLAILSSSSI